jgi:hypothetical protein
MSLVDVFEDDAPPAVCVYMPQPDFDFLRLWRVQRPLRGGGPEKSEEGGEIHWNKQHVNHTRSESIGIPWLKTSDNPVTIYSEFVHLKRYVLATTVQATPLFSLGTALSVLTTALAHWDAVILASGTPMSNTASDLLTDDDFWTHQSGTSPDP